MHHATVNLRAAEVEQKTMPAGDCVVTGSIKFMDTTNLHPCIDALTKVGEDGRLIAAVMNSKEEDITIQPGTCYGTISLTANGHQAWEEKPWRLCHIQAAVSSHTLPDVKLTSHATYPEDKRESEAIAAVGGTAPKGGKESERKPPLKDHETWSKDKRREWMLENFKLATSPVLNTPSLLLLACGSSRGCHSAFVMHQSLIHVWFRWCWKAYLMMRPFHTLMPPAFIAKTWMVIMLP
jgi:hypothetical protein